MARAHGDAVLVEVRIGAVLKPPALAAQLDGDDNYGIHLFILIFLRYFCSKSKEKRHEMCIRDRPLATSIIAVLLVSTWENSPGYYLPFTSGR